MTLSPAQPAPSPEDLRSQLSNAIALRSAQDSVLWAIFGAFWASNAVLLVALFGSGGLPSNRLVGVVIAAVGATFSMVWQHIQGRAIGHISRQEAVMRAVEERLLLPAELQLASGKRPGLRARTLMRACAVGGFVAWVLAGILVSLVGCG